MPKKSKSKSTAEKEMKKRGIELPKTEKKETKEAPKIKEIKVEKKQSNGQEEEEPEFFNGEFTEEILTAESRGRALPILMSGMIQEKPIDSLEEFAETLPTPEEKTDKGYTASKYGFGSYISASNYEKNDKSDYESKAAPIQPRTEPDRTFTTPTMQPSSTRESEAKESLEHFSQQQQQDKAQREEENQPAFRHREKRN